MKILYVNHYAGSIHHGMEFRPYYLAREWKKSGHIVRIVACSFSHLRSRNPIVKADLEIEQVDGIEYQWLGSSPYRGNGFGRLKNILKFVAKLVFYGPKVAKDFKPDLIIASSTYPLDVLPCWMMARLCGAKVFHEVHDLWPLTLTAINGMSKLNPFVLLLQLAEDFSYRFCDGVISMLPGALSYMKEHGLKEERFKVVTNGVVLEDWASPSELPERTVENLQIACEGSRFLLGYAGYHGSANSLQILLEAFLKLKQEGNREIHLALFGDGPHKELLRKFVVDQGLSETVFFFESVPKSAIPTLLARFDACFIGAPKSMLYKYGISPNKLFDYMMAGKPIIQAIEAFNDWVTEFQCGISIPPENAEELKKAILRLSQLSPGERESMGRNGNNFVMENLEYGKLAKKFIEAMR